MDDNDATTEYTSIVTSTPQKTEFNYEDCINQSQCTDCFVRQEMVGLPKHKVHFAYESQLQGW